MKGSVTNYAIHRGLKGYKGATESAVRKALDRRWIAREPDGTLDFEKSDAAWALKAHRRSAPDSSVGGGANGLDHELLLAKTRKERALATRAELEVAQRQGDLVSVSELERRAASVAAMARQGLEGMPARVAPTLAGLTDLHLIQDALDIEVRTFLSNLVDGLARLADEASKPEAETQDETDLDAGSKIS